MGLNCIRSVLSIALSNSGLPTAFRGPRADNVLSGSVPFNYRHFESDDEPGVWLEKGFQWLERIVNIVKPFATGHRSRSRASLILSSLLSSVEATASLLFPTFTLRL